MYRKPVCIDGLYQYVRLASNTKVLLIPRLPFVTPGLLKIEASSYVDYTKSASGLLDADVELGILWLHQLLTISALPRQPVATQADGVPICHIKYERTARIVFSVRVKSMARIAAFLTRRRSPVGRYIRMNRWLWKRLPSKLRNTRLMRGYGTILHKLVLRRADRRQFIGTFFFRNRPQLELMRRLTGPKPGGSTLNIAILGCSIGAEIYSILSTLRAARPDLNVTACAVDNSAEVLNVAKEAVYTSQLCDFVGSSIFERMTDTEFGEMFESDGEVSRVKSWIREGISWQLGDAGDPGLVGVIGHQDMVVASNFLCHMQAAEAESCLRNMARLVKPGGHLIVTGIDLDIRAKVARELGWRPVLELIEDIHEGDPTLRQDWPCEWWGLEPLSKDRPDWQMRYATAFSLKEDD